MSGRVVVSGQHNGAGILSKTGLVISCGQGRCSRSRKTASACNVGLATTCGSASIISARRLGSTLGCEGDCQAMSNWNSSTPWLSATKFVTQMLLNTMARMRPGCSGGPSRRART